MFAGAAHAVPPNICVSANGNVLLAQGNTMCASDPGSHSHAVTRRLSEEGHWPAERRPHTDADFVVSYTGLGPNESSGQGSRNSREYKGT